MKPFRKVYALTKFELGGVHYYITKVVHNTNQSGIAEVHFEQVNFPHQRFVRSGSEFLTKTSLIFTDEQTTTTELQDFYRRQYKGHQDHPHK